jgi:hypothetical protein
MTSRVRLGLGKCSIHPQVVGVLYGMIEHTVYIRLYESKVFLIVLVKQKTGAQV